MVNDTTRLLDLDGLVVVKVEDGMDGQPPVVHLATAHERARHCPRCARQASRVKQWATTTPRDVPVAGWGVRLRWRKRRWYCDNADCDRGTFTESVPQVPKRSRLTRRLRAAAGAAVADAGRTVVQAARDHQVSWPVVCAAFTAYAEQVLPHQPAPVAALGIDEVRRGRPRWVIDEATGTWATAVDRWYVGFVDLTGGQGLLGQVEGRTSAGVLDWLYQRPPAWREQVRFVAIDRCPAFAKAAHLALPAATPSATCRHAGRGSLSRRTAGQPGRHRDPPEADHDPPGPPRPQGQPRVGATQPADPLGGTHARRPPRPDGRPATRAGTLGIDLLTAWNAKEDLLDLLALARTNPDREQIARLLYRFYRRCAISGLPELERLATTLESRWPQVLAFIHTGVTNAGSEGTNRVIKTIARDAYGFRNPHNQRLRTRCATTRRARGCLNPLNFEEIP